MGNELVEHAATKNTTIEEPRIPRSHVKLRLKEEILSKWQRSWDDPSTMDKFAYYLLLPKVKPQRLWSAHILNAYITKHGDFSESFRRFKDIPTS